MKKFLLLLPLILVIIGLFQPLYANEVKNIHETGIASLELNGTLLSAMWALPFLGMILSIAILPLVLPKFWGKYYGTVAFTWAAITFIGLAIKLRINGVRSHF